MCEKYWPENDVRAVTGYQSNMQSAGVVSEYTEHSTHHVPIYLDAAAAAVWDTCMSIAPAVCNDKNISAQQRKDGFNSFTRCIDMLAAFCRYTWDGDTTTHRRKYTKREDYQEGDFVLVYYDRTALSFYWVWKRFDPETKIVTHDRVMNGGLIFHRQYFPHGEVPDALRGSWSIHT